MVVFFKFPGEWAYPFNKEEYWQSYVELAAEVEKQGAQLYITRDQSTYLGQGTFSDSWLLSAGRLEDAGKITADTIYDKGSLVHDDSIPVLNNNQVNNVCTDKWETYQRFKEFCPVTYLINNQAQLLEKLPLIKTQQVVIKPLDGEEGAGVHVVVPEVAATLTLTYPVLLQEFIDSSQGIPGLMDGIHDFRVVFLDGQVVYSFLRTPPKGELKANVALGGTLLVVETQDIPAAFMELAAKVDAKMAEFGTRLYGIDMALDQGVPKIIELNSRLGLQANQRHPIFIQFKQQLAQKLVALAQ